MIELNNKSNKTVFFPCLKMVALGRAYELLRADVREHLTLAKKTMGFEYCRFHALFHKDMDVVYVKEDGSIGYHWHHIDKIYDFLLSIGMKPFIELNGMPEPIASGTQTMFWYAMNVTPPKSQELWYDLVFNFTAHITERYGVEEVSKWFFEVWNEPNLGCFWGGSQQDYFDLYETSAKAVKRVCPEYRVGGPATATADWIADTISYCTKNSIPLDFITTHLYPQDEYCLYPDRAGSPYENLGEYFIGEVKKVKETVANSERPDLKIYWTEFNTHSTDCSANITFLNNTALDRLYGASCLTRYAVETMDFSDGMAYWTVSDIFEESQMRHTPFSGTYGLITIQGIKKATFNAFELMKRVKGDRFKLSFNAPLGCGALAAEENGIYRILLYNCNLPEIKNQPDWSDFIVIPNTESEDYICEQAKITKGRGSAYEEWIKMGKPANLTAFEEAYLRACAEMEYSVIPFCDDECKISFSLKPDEVCYIEIHKKTDNIAVRTENGILENQLNTGVGKNAVE